VDCVKLGSFKTVVCTRPVVVKFLADKSTSLGLFIKGTKIVVISTPLRKIELELTVFRPDNVLGKRSLTPFKDIYYKEYSL
jgi:hypothetical protein